jgi:hypothetical protein
MSRRNNSKKCLKVRDRAPAVEAVAAREDPAVKAAQAEGPVDQGDRAVDQVGRAAAVKADPVAPAVGRAVLVGPAAIDLRCDSHSLNQYRALSYYRS